MKILQTGHSVGLLVSDENIDQKITYHSVLLHHNCVLIVDSNCSYMSIILSLRITTGRMTCPFSCYDETWDHDHGVYLRLIEQEGLWMLSLTRRYEDAVCVLLKSSADILWDVKRNMVMWIIWRHEGSLGSFLSPESFFCMYFSSVYLWIILYTVSSSVTPLFRMFPWSFYFCATLLRRYNKMNALWIHILV